MVRELLCPFQGSPSTTLPIACMQCACFFYDLIPHMPRHHTAACIAAMQLVTPSNSGKLPGILGVPRCTLEAPPYFQRQLPPNFYALQHPPLGSRCFPPPATFSGSSHTSTLQTINSSYVFSWSKVNVWLMKGKKTSVEYWHFHSAPETYQTALFTLQCLWPY